MYKTFGDCCRRGFDKSTLPFRCGPGGRILSRPSDQPRRVGQFRYFIYIIGIVFFFPVNKNRTFLSQFLNPRLQNNPK